MRRHLTHPKNETPVIRQLRLAVTNIEHLYSDSARQLPAQFPTPHRFPHPPQKVFRTPDSLAGKSSRYSPFSHFPLRERFQHRHCRHGDLFFLQTALLFTL